MAAPYRHALQAYLLAPWLTLMKKRTCGCSAANPVIAGAAPPARPPTALLVRQTLAVTRQPVRAAAWHDLPTTYVVCTEDRGTSAAAQRKFSRRADNVIEVKAGHHPFLSQPQIVADIIASLS